MVEEGIRGGICHAIQCYAHANNKYMKDYDRKKKSSYIQYLNANNLYGKAMTAKLPVRGFRWMEDISKIDEDFVNTELRKKATNDFEKDFFKLINNAVFRKTMENVRKHRDIKLVKSDKKRNKLVSEPNFHTKKLSDNNLAIIEMRKVKVKMNKPIYLGLSVFDISKITMYAFWYDYVKIKYQDKARLCYMDTDSFVVNIKTKDFYKDISQDVNKRFDTWNYTFDRPLPTGISKKVIGLMKDELGGDIITEFVALRPKAYSYATNNFIEMKKAKGTKNAL